MRDLLYDAARHYRRGRALADRGDVRGAMAAFEDALNQLHAVKPQQLRDVLLAQVYLSRSQVGASADRRRAASDLRTGYSYARTTHEPTVRQLAERLWRAHLLELANRPPPPPAAITGGERQAGKRGRKRRRGGRGRKPQQR